MKSKSWKKNSTYRGESGQALVFLVLALGLVFVAAGALSVDMSNLWFHRQAAQNAADAACTAGAMDLLVDAQGLATGHQNFAPGTAFSCTGSTASPCRYAAMNGYNSNNTSPGNLVSVSFPTTVPGVPAVSIPSAALAPTAFMRVDVVDNIQTYFSGLLSGSRAQTVRAFAVCGVVLAAAPVPMLVLAPTGNTVSLGGNSGIAIVGGPQRSIQVNSSSNSATSGGIDLSHGGPNQTGSDIGVFGGPATNPGVSLGSTGHYLAPAAPVPDPYATLAAPQKPSITRAGPIATKVTTLGCPDSNGCDEYAPGYYANGIDVSKVTAIFDPGIYYLDGTQGLFADTQSCMYPSQAVGDGSGGTIFYFNGTGTFGAKANAGKKCDPFPSTTGAGSIPFGAKCTAASQFPTNVPATISGNVLFAPCKAPDPATGLCAPNCNLNYGDPLGTADPIGEQRGILFFQNRSVQASVDFSGGGQFLFTGTVYIHQCVSGGADTGVGCTATAYKDSMGFGGNSGSSTIVGQIVTDSINMHGTPNITMDLVSAGGFNLMKATLLR
jgi:hypothetical protein